MSIELYRFIRRRLPRRIALPGFRAIAPPTRRRTRVTRTAVTWLLPGERDLGALVLEARLQPVAGVVVPQLALEIAGHDVFAGGDRAARRGDRLRAGGRHLHALQAPALGVEQQRALEHRVVP